MAKNNELGYGKNEKDWAIRRLTTYLRYDRKWLGLRDRTGIGHQ